MDIILVEDDPAVRHSLKILLSRSGHRVRDYATGRDALGANRVAQGDCLIVDYLLPDTDGLALIQHFRSVGWQGNAILISGFFDHSLERRALIAGYDAVYEKPFHYPDVALCVAQFVTR